MRTCFSNDNSMCLGSYGYFKWVFFRLRYSGCFHLQYSESRLKRTKAPPGFDNDWGTASLFKDLTSGCACVLSMSFSSLSSLRSCSRGWPQTDARSSNITGQFTSTNLAHQWQFLSSWISRSTSTNRGVILWVWWSLQCMSKMTSFDITVRMWFKNLQKFVVMAMNLNSGADLDSLPILDNPDNLVVYSYAAFIWKLSYVAINTVPQFRSSRSYSACSFTKQRLLISCIPCFCSTIYLVSQIACWNVVSSFLLSSVQSVSPLNRPLSISVGLLTRIMGGARWPTIFLSMVLRFSLACDSFTNGSAKHGCDGTHGVGWLLLCVCVRPLSCRGPWFSAGQSHFNLSRQLWMCRLSVQRAFAWAQYFCFVQLVI